MGVSGVWKSLPVLALFLFSGLVLGPGDWRDNMPARAAETIIEAPASIPVPRNSGKAAD